LYERLWAVQADLTAAANRLIGALWQVRIGTLPWPTREAKGGGEERVPLQTLAYQGLSGKWRPFGTSLYAPIYSSTTASSAVILDLASSVHTRLDEDFVDIQRGKRSLPTFRSLPLGLTTHGVEVAANGDVTLRLWPGKGANSITVAPRKIDASARVILRRCAEGTLKAGGAKLAWVAPEGRKGKWLLSVQWTGDVERATGEVFAGLDLGLRQSATLCCVSTATGKATRSTDILRLPASVMRGWRRWEAERRERGGSNRAVFQRRAGRGVGRKMRSLDALQNKQARLVDAEVAELAAGIVRQAKARGAVGIAIEDLTTWSVGRLMDEAGTNAERADRRKRYLLGWHQGAIRARVKEVAAREGLACIEVSARDSSRTCAACGRVYADVHPRTAKETGAKYGYLAWDRFACECGHAVHGERNAALVLAQRGLLAWRANSAGAVSPPS
jgi:hypothetical protein